MKEECKYCRYYEGDCGKHHIDYHKHIHYDIPAEYATNCFRPSEEFIVKQREEKAKELSKYSLDVLKRALEMARESEETKDEKKLL